MNQRFLKSLMGVGLMVVLSGPAMATATLSCTGTNQFDSIVTLGNGAGGTITGTTGPFGEICITLTSPTTAVIQAITFDGFLMGDGSTLALEVNSTNFALVGGVGGISGSTFITAATIAFPGGNVNGFGQFDFIIDSSDGFADATSSLTFTLQDISGTWLSAADVLTTNANGADAVMHIFVSSLCSQNLTCTGFAAEGPGTITETPEPGILSLLGIGLVGMGLTALRRRKA